jgi:glutaredoxin
MRARPTVTVYTRRGCHLCLEAERVVAERALGRADVEYVDIDARPDITERYTVRVPVVAVNGRELFEYQVDPRAFERALAEAAGGS